MDRPNILIVMADQLTFALTGPYGHQLVRTPAMDALAASGVVFDAAYTPCPLCTPARAALFSGRLVSRTRTYDNGSILPADVPTFAHHLRAGGYEVTAAGKMHFVGPDQLHGLERRLTPDIYPADFSWTPDDGAYDYAAPGAASGQKARTAREAGPCRWSDQLAYDENVHARALEFLRGRHDRPFCLLVSYSHPHPPYRALRRLWDLYEDAEIALPESLELPASRRGTMERWLHGFQGLGNADATDADWLRRVHRSYYAMVTYVDEKLGELRAGLEAADRAETTAVVFCSDHGDMLGTRRQLQKRLFYEWSVRVPLIASFPRAWPGGRRIAEPVSLLDLFPTLTDLAATDPPEDVDGQSLLPVLAGGAPRAGRIVFSEYHGEGVRSACFMARKGPLKYVHVHPDEHRWCDLSLGEDFVTRGQLADPGPAPDELRDAVARRFDASATAADLLRSRRERLLMRRAMSRGTPTRWDAPGRSGAHGDAGVAT